MNLEHTMRLAEGMAFDQELEEGIVSKTIGIAGLIASAVFGKSIKAPDQFVDAYKEAKTERAQKAVIALTVAQDLTGGGDIFGEIGARLTKSVGKEVMEPMSDALIDLSMKTSKATGGVMTTVMPAIATSEDEAKAELAKSLTFAQENNGEDLSKLGEIVVDEVRIGGVFSKKNYYVAYPKNGKLTSMFKSLLLSVSR